MAQLASKIRAYVGRDVDFTNEVTLQDDSQGSGPYISSWNIPESQPTIDQLNGFESEADSADALSSTLNKRRTEYGSFGNQLDMIYWDGVNGTTTWQDHIAKVKADYPKV
jgi:hypothetical protein